MTDSEDDLERRLEEVRITDQQTPEVRALINEFDFKTIMTGITMLDTHDPERLRQFAEAARGAAQRKVEKENTGLGLRLLRKLLGVKV